VEERLVFDLKDVGIRVVCRKCGAALSVGITEWRQPIGSCPAGCGIGWKRSHSLHDLAGTLRDLAALQDDEDQQEHGFLVRFEVSARTRLRKVEAPVAWPPPLPDSPETRRARLL
jgi:hypothetical protein